MYTTLCSWQKKKYENLRSKDQKLLDTTFIHIGLVVFVNVTINFSYLVNEDEDLKSIQLDVQCCVRCLIHWDYGKSI
ncbi:6170_t:CDS:2 [Dentiscutata erythropus]|uniref:6170_t:CDS:1 n=1 Tax=Dentiscutata erythropus TaxID=1348616 RepID=A0A9N9BCS5_9GLOM|nr:6170_t:CDS:2 [Dentiscutata erythropus]